LDNTTEKAGDSGVYGPGWVIEIHGHHYHNSQEALNREEASYAYVIKNFLAKFATETVTFQGAENPVEGGGEFKFSDFGVFYPTLIHYSEPTEVSIAMPKPSAGDATNSTQDAGENQDRAEDGAATQATTPAASATASADRETVRRCDFIVQFAWIPRSRADRFRARELRLKAEEATKNANPPADGSQPVASTN
jgi:hypothetical protein